MKITITADAKKYLTLTQLPIAKQVIKDMKEDEFDYAEQAARIASDGYVVKVYETKATIAGNYRVWNQFGDGSGTMDVWVDFTALTSEGFIMGGAYLSDLWSADGENLEYIREHMYIRKFTETK